MPPGLAHFIPPAVQALAFAGHPWYEEDCDAALVEWFIPGFTAREKAAAYASIKRNHPDVMSRPDSLSHDSSLPAGWDLGQIEALLGLATATEG